MPHVLADGNGKIDDPRGVLDKLRRKELETILANEGIQAPRDIPAEAARQLIRSANVDFNRYVDDQMNFLWPERPVKAADAVDYDDLDEWRMPHLRKLASQMGVSFKATDNKESLISKIRAQSHGEPA